MLPLTTSTDTSLQTSSSPVIRTTFRLHIRKSYPLWIIFCEHTQKKRSLLIMRTRGGSSRRAGGLQPSLKNVRQKIPPNGQTRLKFGFSYEISQHNHFRYFRHHFGSTFPRNPTKPMFRSFPTTPQMRWRFQHAWRWIWRFRGCLGHSPKRKKRNNTLQETWWYIRLSQRVFVFLTMNY